MEKRVAVRVDGSYDRVRIFSKASGSYSDGLILANRRERRVEDVEIESQKPWIPVVVVSATVVRRRMV